MVKLDIINSCLEFTGTRQVLSYNSLKPEQLLANNILENTTYEVTSIINSLNPLLLDTVGITSNFDTLAALIDIESILNYIRVKTTRNYVNIKVSAKDLVSSANEQLKEATYGLVQYMISKSVPTSYLDNVVNELDNLLFSGIFDTTDIYVKTKAKIDYKIDLFMTFNVDEKVNTLQVEVDNVKKQLNGAISKTINNGPTQEIIDQVIIELCSNGWYFNTSYKYELIPDNLGFINLSSNVLKLINSKNYIKKSGKLYDQKNETFIFNENVFADIVVLINYQDLPELAKDYVDIKANRRFISLLSSKLGKDKYRGLIQRYTDKEEAKALLNLRRENNRTAKLNIFNDRFVRRILDKTNNPKPIVPNY